MRRLFYLPAIALLLAFTYAPAPPSISFLGRTVAHCDYATPYFQYLVTADASKGRNVKLKLKITDGEGRTVDNPSLRGKGPKSLSRNVNVDLGVEYYAEAFLYSMRGRDVVGKLLDSDNIGPHSCPTPPS